MARNISGEGSITDILIFPRDLFEDEANCVRGGRGQVSSSHEIYVSRARGDFLDSGLDHSVNAHDLYRPEGFRVVGFSQFGVGFPQELSGVATFLAQDLYSDLRIVPSCFFAFSDEHYPDRRFTPVLPVHVVYAKPGEGGKFLAYHCSPDPDVRHRIFSLNTHPTYGYKPLVPNGYTSLNNFGFSCSGDFRDIDSGETVPLTFNESFFR